ncbi:murein hydrolase activator EnvC [Brachybacterium sp. YJGR34]|uniref:murein hydrolase activator EnvC family protein n=1 Tax=Brachybacterium sp. YJGR34 TaxID=2059911 RepID=UPI000E0C50C3|nr:M23 family metallopeptidase [Brachybacterium sp. YJGR34]
MTEASSPDLPRAVRRSPALRHRAADAHPWAMRGLLAVLCLALTWALADTARAEGERWRWPVSPPEVLVPFDPPEHDYGPGHRGIDLAVTGEGSAVRAVASGTVRFVGAVAGRSVVSVLHADGLISTYEPVAGVVEEGRRVEAGAVLGTISAPGPRPHCPGAECLHLGARRGGTYLDPLLLLGGRGPSVLLPWDADPAAPPAAGVRPSLARGVAPLRRGGGPGRSCGAAARR